VKATRFPFNSVVWSASVASVEPQTFEFAAQVETPLSDTGLAMLGKNKDLPVGSRQLMFSIVKGHQNVISKPLRAGHFEHGHAHSQFVLEPLLAERLPARDRASRTLDPKSAKYSLVSTAARVCRTPS
jgi:hypothetical protein